MEEETRNQQIADINNIKEKEGREGARKSSSCLPGRSDIVRNVRLDDGAFHLSEFIYYFNSPYHELIGRWELGVGCDLGFLPNV